jgi:nitric oxide dioxygenase
MTDTCAPVLSPQTIETVKATAPILKEHGVAITTRMYEILFTEHPEVKELFSSGPGEQEKRLADAVLAYATNIDKLETLTPVVQNIATKHVAKGVQADHYPVVGATLLTAMGDVLGPLDASIVDAWAEAYGYLADIFITTEAELRSA